MKRTTDASPAATSLAMSTKPRRRNAIAALFAAALALLLALPSFASADPLTGSATLFKTGLRPTSWIFSLTAGSDGNVWFTDGREIAGTSGIGRITPSGEITEYIPGGSPNFSGLNAGSYLVGIATGPDKKLWVTDIGTTPAIAAIDPAEPTKTIEEKEFSTGLNAGSRPQGIVAGADGNLWFADTGTTPAIGMINPSTHEIKEFSTGLNAGSRPHGIVAGADGNLWFTDTGTTRAIGRINPTTQEIMEFPTGELSFPGSQAGDNVTWGIAAGADGNVWFTENGSNATEGRSASGKAVGRITPSGEITYFSSGLLAGSKPFGLTAAPDGKLWFTDHSGANEVQKVVFEGTWATGNLFKLCNEAKTVCSEKAYSTTTTTVRNNVKGAYEAIYGAGTVKNPACSGTPPFACIVTFSEEGSLVNTNVGPVSCEAKTGIGTCKDETSTEGVADAIGSITTSGEITRYPVSGLFETTGITYSGGNAWFASGAGPVQRLGKLGIEPPLTVKVTKTGSGAGTVTSSPSGINCGSECSKEFTSGTEVTLTASAEPGSAFTGWTGCTSEEAGKCKVKVSGFSEIEVKANFGPAYSLTVSKLGAGSGTVESSPSGINCGGTCTAEFGEGKVVTLNQSAASGSEFRGWSGACSGTGACEVTMTEAKSVSARFANAKQLLTVEKNANGPGGTGTVSSKPKGIKCGAACSLAKASLYKGTSVELSAKAGSTSTFSGWEVVGSPGACPGTGTCTVSMTEAKTVKALFGGSSKEIAQAKALTALKAGTGEGTVKASGLACEAACTETKALYQGEITSPKVKAAKEVELVATAAYGSTFTGFSGSGCSGTEPCKVLMKEAHSVTATFAAKAPQTLTITKNSYETGTGTVSSKPKGLKCATTCATQAMTVPQGEKVLLTEKPASGMEFEGWEGGGCSGASPTCEVTVSAPTSVKAKFKFISTPPKAILNPQTLTLSKAGDGSGYVKASGLSCEAACATATSLYTGGVTEPKIKPAATVVLTAIAAPGSKLTGWSAACESPTINEAGTEGTCTVITSAAKEVTASFDQ